MSELIIFNTIKTALEDVEGIEFVDTWRNQFEKVKEENQFQLPCALIQMTRSNFTNLTMGLQMYDVDVAVHIGYGSYKDTDLDLYTLKQLVYEALHRLQPETTCSMLLRTGEDEQNDHDVLTEFIQHYKTTVKDYDKDIRPTKPATVGPVITVTIDN